MVAGDLAFVEPQLEFAKHLTPYGYNVDGPWSWQVVPSACSKSPRLSITMCEHREVDNHTHYDFKCRLESDQGVLDWKGSRRLNQLRSDLFNPVVDLLGTSSYAQLFREVPFAMRGGVPGTTQRLSRWLRRLADCVNQGHVSPALASRILQFLGTPRLPEHESYAAAAAAAAYESLWRSHNKKIQRLYMEELAKHFEYEAAERCLELCHRGAQRTQLLLEVVACFVRTLEDHDVRTEARGAVWDDEEQQLVPLDGFRRARLHRKINEALEIVLASALRNAAAAACLADQGRRPQAVSLLEERRIALRADCDDLLSKKALVTEEIEIIEERLAVSLDESMEPDMTKTKSLEQEPRKRTPLRRSTCAF